MEDDQVEFGDERPQALILVHPHDEEVGFIDLLLGGPLIFVNEWL